MKVNVEHRLTSIAVAVDDGAIAGGIDAALLGNQAGASNHRAHELVISSLQIVQGRNVPFGNDQNVHRRFRLDVLECQQLIIFVHAFCGDFPGDNLAEQARHEGEYSPAHRAQGRRQR